jgi:hypothetical protein
MNLKRGWHHMNYNPSRDSNVNGKGWGWWCLGIVVVIIVLSVLFTKFAKYEQDRKSGLQPQLIWEIQVVKLSDDSFIDPGWEPFGYDPKTGAVYVKRQLIVEDERWR